MMWRQQPIDPSTNNVTYFQHVLVAKIDYLVLDKKDEGLIWNSKILVERGKTIRQCSKDLI